MKIPIFDYTVVWPLADYGYTSKLWSVHLDTLIYTWIAMGGLFLVALVARILLYKKPNSIIVYGMEQGIDFFSDLCIESFGNFRYNYFAFVSTLFSFTLACNLTGTLPFIDESTKDINTAAAIALLSFFYVQYQAIRIGGLLRYLGEYIAPVVSFLPSRQEPMWFAPFSLVLRLMLNIVGIIGNFFLTMIDKMGKIISMSFRLFGNIMGGSIVFFLLIHLISLLKNWFMIATIIVLGIHVLLERIQDERRLALVRRPIRWGWLTLYCLAGLQMFFSIFEGVIQAFVIAMLTITYLSLIINEHKEAQENKDDEVETEVIHDLS